MSDIALAKVSEFQDMIARLDRKASFLMGAVALLIGLMGGQSGGFVLLALGAAVVSLLASVWTLWPRTPTAGNDLSWVTIATQDESRTVHYLQRYQTDEGVQLIATHLKTLARICSRKVKSIRIAVIFLVFSSLFILAESMRSYVGW